MMDAGNASIVSFNMSEPDIEAIMRAPFTMASSDGGLSPPGAGLPHPRDYGAFARRLAVYVRDRKVVGLEFAIRSMTSLPASVFGLRDRGVIRPGAFADLVIFDPAPSGTPPPTRNRKSSRKACRTSWSTGFRSARWQVHGALPGRVLRSESEGRLDWADSSLYLQHP